MRVRGGACAREGRGGEDGAFSPPRERLDKVVAADAVRTGDLS